MARVNFPGGIPLARGMDPYPQRPQGPNMYQSVGEGFSATGEALTEFQGTMDKRGTHKARLVDMVERRKLALQVQEARVRKDDADALVKEAESVEDVRQFDVTEARRGESAKETSEYRKEMRKYAHEEKMANIKAREARANAAGRKGASAAKGRAEKVDKDVIKTYPKHVQTYLFKLQKGMITRDEADEQIATAMGNATKNINNYKGLLLRPDDGVSRPELTLELEEDLTKRIEDIERGRRKLEEIQRALDENTFGEDEDTFSESPTSAGGIPSGIQEALTWAKDPANANDPDLSGVLDLIAKEGFGDRLQ